MAENKDLNVLKNLINYKKVIGNFMKLNMPFYEIIL